MDFSNQNTITESPQPDREGAHQKPLLFRLPPEILQKIPDYLPLASAACFSLSCRSVYTMLGTKYLIQLEPSQETYAFLTLLERDIPDSVSCKSCKVLHPIKDAESHIDPGWEVEPRGRPCLLDARMTGVSAQIYFGFSPVVFKMLMKHHSLFGFDNRSHELIKLLSPKPDRRSWNEFTMIDEVQIRIKSGSLFICTTETWECESTAVVQEPELLKSMRPRACRHIDFRLNPDINLLGFEESRYNQPSDRRSEYFIYPDCRSIDSWEDSTILRCRHCRTEHRAHMKFESSSVVRVSLTSWKGLGKGPDDEVYYQNLHTNRSRIPEGKIIAAFESGLP